MRKSRVEWRWTAAILSALMILSCAVLRAEPAAPTEAITVTDADGKRVTLNKTGQVTVVFLCSEDTQTEIRDAAGQLDKFRGLPTFRLIAVVDMRDSIGGMMEGIVKWRMQEDLDDEAERLEPYYRANGNKANPRKDLSAVPDFKGDISRALGWPKTGKTLRCVVYGTDGKPIQRWDALTKYQQLYDVVAKALER